MITDELYPLTFDPIFKEYGWGGRNLAEKLGRALPDGIVAESWEWLQGLNLPMPAIYHRVISPVHVKKLRLRHRQKAPEEIFFHSWLLNHLYE